MGSKLITAQINVGGGSGISGAPARRLPMSRADLIRTGAALVIVIALLAIAFSLSGREGTGAQASFSLLIGASLGIVFERARFCFFCIFRDAIEDKNTTPFLSVLSAIAVGSIVMP